MKLCFRAGVEYKNVIYFSAMDMNGLFAMDIKSRQVEFLNLFKREKISPRLHRMAFLYKDEAWFIPEGAEYIVNINLNTLDIIYHEVPHHKKNKSEDPWNYCVYLSGHVIQDRYLCLIPAEIDAVLMIDMEEHKLYPFYDVIDPGKKILYNGVSVGDELYLCPAKGDVCKKLNLKTNERTNMMWEYPEMAFGSIDVKYEKIWFTPFSADNILCIDIATGEKYRFKIPQPEDRYSGMMALDKKLVFLPFKAKNFLLFDRETCETELNDMEKETVFVNHDNKVSAAGSAERAIVAMCDAGCIVIFDKGLGRFTAIPVEIDKNVYEQMIRALKETGRFRELFEMWDNIVLENGIGMDDFLTELVNVDPHKEAKAKITIGKVIWKNIINRGNKV